ncbi:MAG: nucleotidyltransferase domain-containing protein, partial [Acidobacteria bacterium ACB2]|nr:nucleotidyltransferase domain-containing protein [Acidobacteria bacterium ACB2]
DLVVVLDTDAPFFRRLAELRRILRPVVATDILAYTPAELERLVAERPFVRDEILGSGRVLYERAA